MRQIIRLALALALLAGPVLAADPAVTSWKKDMDSASLIGKVDERAEAEAKAFERLTGATTPEAAQAAMGVVLDGNALWRTHDAALKALRSMTAETIRAWATKELSSAKDPHERAVVCSVAASWPDGWKLALSALKDKDAGVLAAAADALVTIHEKDVVAALIAALKDAKEIRVQGEFYRALSRLTGKDFTDGALWESWWKENQDKFTFAADASAPPPDGSGIPKTTSNGSGLYETVSTNHVVFVIDTSYSMRTTGEVQDASGAKKLMSRLDYVKNELVNVIDAQIGKKCWFNIIQFNTKVTPWKGKLVEGSDVNKKAAKGWVLALQPEAETDTYDALELAFADKTVDTIYLLTDGSPTNGKVISMDGIRGEVRKWNDGRKVRVNAICYVVGDGKKFGVTESKDMAKDFMRDLAKDNGGFCKIFE